MVTITISNTTAILLGIVLGIPLVIIFGVFAVGIIGALIEGFKNLCSFESK